MSLPEEKFYQSCSKCQARYAYFTKNVDSEGQVRCQNCGQVMNAGEDSPKDLPHQEMIEIPIISKRFLYGFIITILIMFIFFLFLHSTVHDTYGYPDGIVFPFPSN